MESDPTLRSPLLNAMESIIGMNTTGSKPSVIESFQIVGHKPNSTHLKAALLSYFRFKRQNVAGEEVNDCDVLVIDKKGLVYDIEVKISKSDLWQGEKRKRKHKDYLTPGASRFVRYPNYFYLCVPTILLEEAEKWVLTTNPKYGIIEYKTAEYPIKPGNNRFWEDMVAVKRRAKPLDEVIRPKWMDILTRRLSSAVCGFKQALCAKETV